MRTGLFWRQTAERGVKTVAQTTGVLLAAGPFGILDAPWTTSLSLAGMAGVLSILTSVGSASVGDDESPSLVGEP